MTNQELYALRRTRARRKAEEMRPYLESDKTPEADREAAREYLYRVAWRNGLVTEFKEKGYL